MEPSLGPIERKLVEGSRERTLLAVLFDPFNVQPEEAGRAAREAEESGADIILVGGSVGAGLRLHQVVRVLKESTSLPVILFPGNVDGVSPGADAMLFMSLLNSTSPYWIIEAQALAAPMIRALQIEAIPTAYLIVEPGGSSAAGWVGRAREIPRKKPEIAVAYSMAARLLGMRWVYLEAGSGAELPVPVEMVSAVKRQTGMGVIVGGGIRSPELAKERAAAGADIIVVGTYLESGDTAQRVAGLAEAVKEGSCLRNRL
ncbi:MAG TPA: geranylgeranylglyceryl/heptaprenylglyceryl phosphate synthase [Candidatus Korarchaeota archaeon]|nr:geranylgeranylglyceryl/heptaprenylglyceryl phosphate synthase [Candidatus Korarchaeota archaeon]